MKYVKLIICLLIIMVDQTAHAKSYIVDTPVLNVRSCAGTNSKIIGKLTEGDTIVSIKDDGEWVEITTENGSGYVIKTALREYNPDIEGVFYVMVAIFFLWFVWCIYMLPAKVAAENKNAGKIYKINLFLGWIPFIWLILLFAALIGERKENVIIIQ